ncbi:hypothetical protein IC607_08435 [Cellulomonas sp. JH27-2]|uniref:hypothetical protein n=1 Tax=Cellulomonas sp. JH27-2 TaxID=2774139 RepID=UPI0017830A03|nr:hypothetical protein [Cellulomonas sp. JH27-2]MBD8058994.1 hypothetical protein [Cellulomonas sp. JH27-2]
MRADATRQQVDAPGFRAGKQRSIAQHQQVDLGARGDHGREQRGVVVREPAAS